MNTLGPKNIAKNFLSYIDPFDNCAQLVSGSGPLTYEGFKIFLCFENVCLVLGFLQCRTRIGDVTDIDKKSDIKSQTKILKV